MLSKGDTPEELKAIADEAHKLGRKVAAHAYGTQSIKDAILAGIDTIEHSSLIGDEGIALAKQRHTYLDFDIYNDDYILAEAQNTACCPSRSRKKKESDGCSARTSARHSGPELSWDLRPMAAYIQLEAVSQNGRMGDEAD